MINDAEHLFTSLFAILTFSLVQVSVHIFCSFKKWAICFLIIDFWGFFIYSGCKSFVGKGGFMGVWPVWSHRPVLRGAPFNVLLLQLKFLISFLQGVPRFHLVLGLINYVADLICWYKICRYFPPSVACLFFPLNSVFLRAKVLHFDKVKFIYLFIFGLPLLSVSWPRSLYSPKVSLVIL